MRENKSNLENIEESKDKKRTVQEFLKRKQEIIDNEDYLKSEECKDGYLYILIARHANVGIFDAKKEAFITNRKKFKENFLFTTY